MRKKLLVIVAALVFSLSLSTGTWAKTATSAPATRPAKAHNFARWEKNVAAFEKQDQEHMPDKGGIEFVGSSTIVRWKTLHQDFPGLNIINRAFGGNEIVDSTHFADRIIFPYAPKQIFLRAGSNDIHAGKSAEQVFHDFQEFVAKVHDKLPDAEIVYISLSPAPIRWSERDENKKLNDLVKEWSKGQPNVKYCETYDLTVTPDGQPREDLFVKDRLHPNAEGYRLLADRVRPFLKK